MLTLTVPAPPSANVDRSHPIAKGMLFDFDLGATRGIPVDRCNRRLYNIAAGTAAATADGGRGLNLTGAGSSYLSIGTIVSPFGGLTQTSIYIRGMTAASGQTQWDDIARHDMFCNVQWFGTNQWAVSFWPNNVGNTIYFTVPDGQVNDVFVTWDGRGNPRAFVNGAEVTVSIWSGNTANWNSGYSLASGSAAFGWGGNLSGAELVAGSVHRYAAWNRALSPSEINTLFTNPNVYLASFKRNAPAPVKWGGAITSHVDYTSSSNSGSYTTPSFTPVANSTLVLVVNTTQYAQSTTLPSLDVAHITGAGGLTWTLQKASPNNLSDNNWAGGVAVFTAPVGASPSAITLTYTPATGVDKFTYGLNVFSITGLSNSAPVVQIAEAHTSPLSGSNTASQATGTLTTAPTFGNLVMAVFGSSNDVAGTYTSIPGYVEFSNQSSTLNHNGVWYSSASTDTSVTCSDVGQAIYMAVGFLIEFAPAGTSTPVTKTGQLLWNVYSQVTKSEILKWNVYSVVTKSLIALWNVFGLATKTVALLWNVGGAITKTLSLLWNVGGSLTKTIILDWNVFTTVSKSEVLKWNVLTTVSQSIQAKWNVFTSVTKTGQLKWNVYSVITKSASLLWNVTTSISKSVSLLWNTNGLASITKTLALWWRVYYTPVYTEQTPPATSYSEAAGPNSIWVESTHTPDTWDGLL